MQRAEERTSRAEGITRTKAQKSARAWNIGGKCVGGAGASERERSVR